MAIGKCRECGGALSSSAAVCPRCGAREGATWRIVWVIVVGVLGVVALFGSFILAWSPGTAMGFIGLLLVITLLLWFANDR